MFGLGIPELLIILFIALLVFGANRLPDIGSALGKAIRGFKEGTDKSAEPPPQVTPGGVFCPGCGKPVAAGANFCPACGKNVKGGTGAPGA